MGKTKQTANLVSNGFLTPTSGKIGIGTDNPGSLVHTLGSYGTVRVENNNTAQYAASGIELKGPAGNERSTKIIHGNSTAGGTQTYFQIEQYDAAGSYEKALATYNYQYDYWAFNTGGIERLRITSDGQLQATGAADIRLTLGSGGTAGTNDSVHMRADGANLKFMAGNGGNTIFETNGTETLRIKSTGEINIKGTQPTIELYEATDTYGWDIFRNSADARLKFRYDDNGTTSIPFTITPTSRIGIGTDNPEEIVHILGPSEAVNSRDGVMLQHSTANANADTGLPIVWSGHIGSQSNYGLASICGRKENANSADAAAYLQFATCNAAGALTERLRIDSSGQLLASNYKSNGVLTIGYDANGNNLDNDYIAFVKGASTEYIRLDGSGRLLVGSTGAINSAYESGSIHLRSDAGGVVCLKRNDGTDTNSVGILEFHSSFGRSALIAVNNDGTHSGSSTPGEISFQTTPSGTFNTPTERLRISSDGHVASGGSLVATANYADVEYFYSNKEGCGMYRNNAYNNCGAHIEVGTDATDGWASVYLNRYWTSGEDERMIEFRISNTTVGSITSNTSGTTYNTTSDIRLKIDINPISDATDKLMNMNPVTHKWKEDPDGDTVHGFIAQEMQKISPESVYGEPDGEMMMSMDYGRITPIIVAALQNAIKEINTLKKRISELEN